MSVPKTSGNTSFVNTLNSIEIELPNKPLESSKSPIKSPLPRGSRPLVYNRINYDKKDILIKCFNEGKTISESAATAGINKSTAKYIINKYNKNDGVLIEKKRGGIRHIKINEVILNRIEQIIEENPCYTLENIRFKIVESENVVLSLSSIRNGLSRLRITLKCVSLQIQLQNSPRTIEERKIYAVHYLANSPEAHKNIIFIDESGFNCHFWQSKARRRSVSLIMAINIQGIVLHETIPQSNINTNIFHKFLQKLFEQMENDNIVQGWIILSNISIHKKQEICNLVQQMGHTLLFLPLYSPIMNPIVEVFTKIKLSARNMITGNENFEQLIDIIDGSVSTVTSDDYQNYYMNMYNKLPSAAAGEPM